MDLTLYSKIVSESSVGESFINDSIDIINNEFANSPSYKNITINDVDEDCQLKTTSKSNKFEIFLRPLKQIQKGMYVVVDSSTFIVTNYVSNKIYPKAEITLCNNTLSWKDSFGAVLEYKCLVTGKVIDIEDSVSNNNERLVVDSNAELVVTVPYNDDTRKITANNRFIFDDTTFEVVGIDKLTEVVDGQGVIKLTINAVSSTVSEPTGDPVVYDDSENSGWGGW